MEHMDQVHRELQALLQLDHTPVLVLNAKVLPRENQKMEALMLGSMTVNQEETQRFRITQMLEPEDLIQE